MTYIKLDYDPYEVLYYRECDKTDKLEKEILKLEEERDIALEEVESFKELFQREFSIKDKMDAKEWLVCTISRLTRLYEELEELT